ncbi:energy-coupling factor ABC transporter ATP-binding protein [Tessaracoccus flavus]|uniref:Cobalt ABC transporter ATP-binding protein n=1 Tax=Tessaracoccus flavus TaxID=1610493 RepID=A0A1Q2CDF5_9ACTN|nr:ABC transporter ATP-binding protein [Tessaracoccus flavus]AQP44110.1 cobalt ABC transporter ATP-binding protein [Tessaracoccus flavus]SDY35341.1 biotin transport system ATP-binding protein [Tessaracoccus flavus]
MISLRAVSVVVPAGGRGERDRALLTDVTLDLPEHRIAVIGANGSGKSTLLRLLNGLRAPTSGTVSVDGLSTVEQASLVRRRVGFVFTDPLAQLLMSTPIEDIELSLRGTVRNRAERARRAQALLDERGLGHLAHQSIYDLSGGERQLVALTSVLAVDPAVLVADEPTTLLDLRNKRALRQVFAGLAQQIIYSTHDLDVAADADRVLVVHDGRIVADGAPDEAIAQYESVLA